MKYLTWANAKRVAKAEALNTAVQAAVFGLLAALGVDALASLVTAKGVGYSTFLYTLIRR